MKTARTTMKNVLKYPIFLFFIKIFKILGYLYLKNSKRLEAVEFYQKSLKFDPNDFETWIEYASLQEHYDIKISLEAYEKALEVINQRRNDKNEQILNKMEEIKPELLNNIGVLKMKMEKFEESQTSLQKALEICTKSEEPRIENGFCKVNNYYYYFFFFFFFFLP